MPESPVSTFETTVNKTHVWLKDLAEIGGFADPAQAYSALRSALHAVRDRLPVEQAVHLGAQLPMLVRGMYYEGWKPTATPTKVRTKEEFLEHIREELRTNTTIDPEQALKATFSLLQREITSGEFEKVCAALPAPIRACTAC